MLDLLPGITDWLTVVANEETFRDSSRFGHFSFTNRTVVHPLGVVALLIAVIGILSLPRRQAIIPMILLVCLVPSAQRVIIGGLDFSFIRILAIFGLLRIVLRSEVRGIRWGPADLAVCILAVSHAWLLMLNQCQC